jgi:FkbM family methyltransferase
MQRNPRIIAEDLGIAPALKAVHHRVAPTARRNRTDNRNLELLLAFVLRPDSSCIDIGAHTGDVLRQIVRHAPDGNHIAFEPLPHLHAPLVAEFPNVDVRSAALSDKPGTSEFTHVVSRPAYSGLKMRLPDAKEQVETIEVAVERLDDVVPPDYLPALVKIDVEGAEYHALLGGLEMLSAARPYVVFEFGAKSAAHYGTTPDDMYSLLTDGVGLRIYDFDGAGPYSRSAFQTAYETGSRFNFVAHV